MKFKIFKDDNGEKGIDLLGGAVGPDNSHLWNCIPLGYDLEDLEVGQISAAVYTTGKDQVDVLVERVV